MANQELSPGSTNLPNKNSTLGVISLSIAIVIGIVEFVAIGLAGVFANQQAGEHSVNTIILGLIIIGGAFLNIAGLVVGIVGLFDKNSKKTAAILGVVFNAMLVIGIICLMVIGTMAKH